ncbi:VIT domain-containing protein [Dysgonomonas sp. 37-18]|nr:VIT domain-containing protein [Dysgonomonas sp. 37-18]
MKKYLLLITFIWIGIYCLAQQVNPGSPTIQVKDLQATELPIRISNVNIDIKVVGPLAVTTVEMTLYNPNKRVLEGELQFPLAEGQNISRFALDINGKLREGVVVEKAKGQEVFESIVRRGVDPGLLEKTQGNNFKTRVYPLFARGTRKVVVAYEQELPKTGDNYRFFLPVEYGNNELDKFNLHITVFGKETQPKIDKTPWGGFTFSNEGDVYQASYSAQKYKGKGQLVFSVPVKNDALTFLEKGIISGETIFYSQVFPPLKEQSREVPKRIALYWDASSSMDRRNFDLEANMLSGYFKEIGNVTVDLHTFNCFLGKAQTFNIRNGNWNALRETLEKVSYDGATRLGALDFADVNADEIFLFSDGLSNFGEQIQQIGGTPISVVCSSLSADHSLLTYLATASGGKYINLLQQAPSDAVKLLLNQNFRLISALYNKKEISDFTASTLILNSESGFSVTGKLKAAKASINLNFGIGDKITYTKTLTIDSRDVANYGNIVERVWAEKKITQLDMLFDRNKEEIEELGKRYNIVTRNTSLIVLENLSDYIQYRIVPPAELLEEYNKSVMQIENDEKAARERQINGVISLFNGRKTWFEKDFTQQPEKVVSKPRSIASPFLNVQSGSVRGVVVDSSGVPIIGATVIVQGTDTGSITDLDGKYSINARNGDILVFKFIGYEPKAVKIENNVANAILEDSQMMLEEVVVGYGIERRVDVTGSVSTVSADELQSLSNALQGRMQGVQITEDTGAGNEIGIENTENGISNQGYQSEDAKAAIELKTWKSNAPYIAKLKSKSDEDLYPAYLAIKEEYKTTPSFFLEVASLFEERELKEKALIILSNLAELEAENYRLLRVLGYRLKQLGYNEYAIEQFKTVLRLRPEEPQSYRDLGLAYAQNNQYQEAVDMLYKIVEGSWDDRFPEIEVIAVEEMNQVIAEANRKKVTLNLLNVDERLIYSMPMDIRVVLNWDTDDSDMDLWVTDPYGEKCYYKYRFTKTGGLMSCDFTGGYGPEEFMIRKAVKGKYMIQANYYGSQEQTVIGPTTVYLDIYTYYATGEEKKKTITLRLSQNKEVINVGEVEF